MNDYDDYYYYKSGEYIGEEQKRTQCFKQEQTQVEALEITHTHLGLLMQSAEMLAFKLNLIGNQNDMKYQSYDYFQVAMKKDIDTVKYDVINFLDFYEKAIIIHNKKFKYVQPQSIDQLKSDLTLWKSKALKNDKRFFSNILNLITTGKYNDSDFPDQDALYEKAKKDNSKFKKSAGFWKTFSVPILKFLSNLVNRSKEKAKTNPNYKPDIHFGSRPFDDSLKKTYECGKKEEEINKKLSEVNKNLYNISISINDGNSHYLAKSVKELNELYKEFKKKYGYEINLDENSLKYLKYLLSQVQLDKKMLEELNKFKIDIDPESNL